MCMQIIFRKMKVCGFSFVRNALKYSYPVKEAIVSVLPLCDHFIVNVGDSEDDTIDLIKGISPEKIRVITSTWRRDLREKGAVLAEETNKAFDAVPEDFDWAFYIQADEILHEKYHEPVRKAMQKWKDREKVEGLLFRYLHFYGSYDYVADSRAWYRCEIRVIRNDKSIRSYRDAQGFRKNGKKLMVKPVDAAIYHYGWVKHPQIMLRKYRAFKKLYHDDAWMKSTEPEKDFFDFSRVDSIRLFAGTHPAVMKERIGRMNWDLRLDAEKKNYKLRYRLLHWLEKFTGKRFFEYRNYRILK